MSRDRTGLTRAAFLRVSSLSLLQQTLSITLDPDHCGCGGRPGGTQTEAIYKETGGRRTGSDGDGSVANTALW